METVISFAADVLANGLSLVWLGKLWRDRSLLKHLSEC